MPILENLENRLILFMIYQKHTKNAFITKKMLMFLMNIFMQRIEKEK